MNTARAFLLSLLLSALILLFPVISGIVIAVNEVTGSTIQQIQGASFFVGGLIGLLITHRLFGSLAHIGLKKIEVERYKDYLFFLPIVFAEMLPLFFGLKTDLTMRDILSFLFFALAVGFAEEVYFRGLILQLLSFLGTKKAILASSLLFSLGHLLNLLAGANCTLTLFQVLLAFSFGASAAAIARSTQSLFIPILWHASHNFLSKITPDILDQTSIFAGFLQVAIYIFFLFYIVKKRRIHQRDV